MGYVPWSKEYVVDIKPDVSQYLDMVQQEPYHHSLLYELFKKKVKRSFGFSTIHEWGKERTWKEKARSEVPESKYYMIEQTWAIRINIQEKSRWVFVSKEDVW